MSAYIQDKKLAVGCHEWGEQPKEAYGKKRWALDSGARTPALKRKIDRNARAHPRGSFPRFFFHPPPGSHWLTAPFASMYVCTFPSQLIRPMDGHLKYVLTYKDYPAILSQNPLVRPTISPPLLFPLLLRVHP